MVADVDICNQALSSIGTQSTIADLTENSTEAQHCVIHYAPTRDELLRKYRWGFARTQVNLTLLAAAAGTPENPSGVAPLPPIGSLYQYAYPANCQMAIRILAFIPAPAMGVPLTGAPGGAVPLLGGPAVKFNVRQAVDAAGNPIKVILTNQSQAILDLIVETTNPNLFDPAFVIALVGRLAAKLVIPLTGDKALAKIAIDNGMRVEAEAATRDANESLTIINPTPDWIRARSYIGAFDEGGFLGPGANSGFWPD